MAVDIGIPYGLADVIAVRGIGWLSDHIALAEGNTAYPSHIAGIINTDPSICLEALSRVRTNPLDTTLAKCSKAWLIHHRTLTDTQRNAIVYAACRFSADDYGWGDIVLQGADALLRDTFWTDKLSAALKNHPICSYVWAAAYGSVGISFSDKLIQSITPADMYLGALASSAMFDVSEIML